MAKKYRVICYMRVEPEDQESMTQEEAEKEKEHAEFLQPENRYEIEEINEDTGSRGRR